MNERSPTTTSTGGPTSSGDRSRMVVRSCTVTLGACRAFDGPVGDEAKGTYSVEEALGAVVQAVVAGDRSGLVDQDVVSDELWEQLDGFAAGGGGSGSTCRDNGDGTKDCEIDFDADEATIHYAILAPAQNAYGWRLTYVGIGGA